MHNGLIVRYRKYHILVYLKNLLGSRFESQSLEEFQKLQIEVLKRFENAMKRLLEMVKNELTHPKNP